MSSHPSLEWVLFCCVACRQHKKGVRCMVEDYPASCRHAGTVNAVPFWRAAGEPRAVDLAEDKERLLAAQAMDRQVRELAREA